MDRVNRLTPPEGITLYPSDYITVSLVHPWRILRWLRIPEASVRLYVSNDGKLHVSDVGHGHVHVYNDRVVSL